MISFTGAFDDALVGSNMNISSLLLSENQKIQEWSLKWQMKINPSKSSTIELGSPKSEATYSINNNYSNP